MKMKFADVFVTYAATSQAAIGALELSRLATRVELCSVCFRRILWSGTLSSIYAEVPSTHNRNSGV